MHVTESARICFPDERILYKQLVTPELIDAHIGEWSLTQMGEGIKVCGRHAVTLNEAAVAAGVRAGTTPAEIREMVREAIGGNIRVVLDQVKKFAETPQCQ